MISQQSGFEAFKEASESVNTRNKLENKVAEKPLRRQERNCV